MAKTAHKSSNTTQRFIEILDIQNDIVLMSGGNACLVVEVKASNFALLSAEEQDAKIFSYASLLNSLSFSIQILIRSKKVDITSYLDQLTAEAANTKNPLLSKQISVYRDFVQELIKVNTVLDKKFYIIIPFFSLETGVKGAKQALGKVDENFATAARSTLHSKAESIHTQFNRLNLKSRTLEREELIRLFYDIYNEGQIPSHQLFGNIVAGK